jgi:hypothetical protein
MKSLAISVLTNVHMLQKVLGACWVLAAVCLVAPILVQHQFIQDEFVPSRLEFALYKTISKLMWSLGLSWVIFVCASGYGGMNYRGTSCLCIDTPHTSISLLEKNMINVQLYYNLLILLLKDKPSQNLICR